MRTWLNRVAVQVHSVAGMVEDDRYCINVLDQIQAIKAALKYVETALLKERADHYEAHALGCGNAQDRKQKFSALVELFGRYEK